MEVTLKFNKSTRAGKTLLGLLEAYVKNNKDIKMYRPHTQADFNAKTRKAMDDVEKGIGLTHCESADDMFDKLGI